MASEVELLQKILMLIHGTYIRWLLRTCCARTKEPIIRESGAGDRTLGSTGTRTARGNGGNYVQTWSEAR